MDIVTGKILKLNGWPEGKIIGLAKTAAQELAARGLEREALLARLETVRETPQMFVEDTCLGSLARECIRLAPKAEDRLNDLRQEPLPFPVWGRPGIDDGALAQMNTAMRLPVSVAGALMPDAHVGYGLPIGGVLATDNVVIPFAVGVDIACRMCLSLYEAPPSLLEQQPARFENALLEHTFFGMGVEHQGKRPPDHAVLDDSAWESTRLLKSLKDRAARQLGTSGSGNHFVEWGCFSLYEPLSGLPPGEYLALLSHSGSRHIGHKVAERYSTLAMEIHPDLEKAARHLAWLSLDSEDGQEYWISMELAGRFASANHGVIHRCVSSALGLQAAAVVENHHNFAWKQTLPDGRTVIVHRKGATPADSGVLGIIPGSMGDAGYVMRGRGAPESLQSVSHGAGRRMSRHAALQSISRAERDAYLKARGVTLLGGGLDESPQAYKPIDQVMAAQQDLLDIVGKFTPRIVRMADEAGDF